MIERYTSTGKGGGNMYAVSGRILCLILILVTSPAFADTPIFSALVEANGSLKLGSGATSSKRQTTGAYFVNFSREIVNCAVTATLRGSGSGQISVVQSAQQPKRAKILTFNSAGTAADRAFTLVASCTSGLAPSPGELVITEIMADPQVVADAVGEWFEIFNSSNQAISLQDLTISTASASQTITENLSIPAGAYFVFGRSLDQGVNGGVPVDAVLTLTLVNSGGSLSLKRNGVTIDAVTYGTVQAGASRTLDPSALNAQDNDDLANWCSSTAVYGNGDHGTPKSPNETCP